MDVFLNLFYILVIGIQLFPYKGSSSLFIQPLGSGSGSGETSGSGLENIRPGPGMNV